MLRFEYDRGFGFVDSFRESRDMNLRRCLIVIHPAVDNLFLVVLLGSDEKVGTLLASFDLHKFVKLEHFAFRTTSIVLCSLVEYRLYHEFILQ